MSKRTPLVTTFAVAITLITFNLESAAQEKTSYKLLKVFEVAGRQGVATDGKQYFVSGSQALYVYSKKGELLKANKNPFADLKEPANHIGDISLHNGELFTGVEWFEDGRGRDIQIAIYDAETLEYKRSIPWQLDSGQVEVSALTVDAGNGLIWMTDWVNGSYIYKYDLDTGKYKGKLHLRPVPQWQQGIAYFNGSLYITADDGNADRKESDNLWRITANLKASATFVQHEFTFQDLRDPGEIEGIAFDSAADEMIVLSNRGKRIVLGMPKGLYPGYAREISEIYVYEIERSKR